MNERILALYKVQAKEWREAEFAAAINQTEAIENVLVAHENVDPQTCSVSYIGKVYLEPYDVCRDNGPFFIPSVEQIKSVYAAAGILSSLNEKTDSDRLMALWADLKAIHKRYHAGVDVGAGDDHSPGPPSFEE